MRFSHHLALLLAATACAPRSPQGAALFVLVKRGEARSTCVRLTLDIGGAQTDLGSRPFKAAGSLGLGIVQQDSESEVTVTAVGGEGAACAATVPSERASVTLRFPANGTANHELTLQRVDTDAGFDVDAGRDGGPPDAGRIDGGIDADGDGSPLGVDCDDTDNRRFPGNLERCFGGIDEDCNNQIDCAQSACAGQACGAGIDGGAMCVASACVELSCGNIQDDDLDTAADCGDPDCATRPCAAGGTCTGAVCQQMMESSCQDGSDNDGDGQIDCLDSDCNNQACNDGSSCRTGDTCVGTVCMTTGMAMCAMPPNTACFQPTGTCNEPDAGCTYTVTPNVNCDDGRRCTTNDRCAEDGGCEGTPLECLIPPNECRRAGSCVEADGGCFYPPVSDGSPCSDGDPCTGMDTCLSGRCEPGAAPVCPPIDCRSVAPGCLADGGCNYVNLPFGTTCGSGRLCDGNGNCGVRFPYTPSNFGEADVPADAGPAIVITCATTWNITAAGVIQASGCNSTVPPSAIIDQPGSPDLLLIHGAALFVGDAGSLTITGDTYAVAIAVTGSITIAGAIDVSATASSSGPGANSACQGSVGIDGRATSTGPRGGALGGSFGAIGGAGAAGYGGANVGVDAGVVSGGSDLKPLRGGCRGGVGGGVGGGVFGRAGGAIQLSAADELRIRGRVTSVGGGGGGGGVTAPGTATEGQGGGGGGSGGAILLEARQVDLSGHVSANGGAGGEARGSSGYAGDPGEAGSPFGTTRAVGGSSTSWGGNGGLGGTRTTPTGGTGLNPENAPGGGGGGGGAVGRIRINAAQGCQGTPATMSPQASSGTSACQY